MNLAFDFDPLYHLYDPEKIRGLQRYFSDETKNGLLYINYPMVESLFDAEGKDGEFFITPTRPLSLCSSLAYKSTIKNKRHSVRTQGTPCIFCHQRILSSLLVPPWLDIARS